MLFLVVLAVVAAAVPLGDTAAAAPAGGEKAAAAAVVALNGLPLLLSLVPGGVAGSKLTGSRRFRVSLIPPGVHRGNNASRPTLPCTSHLQDINLPRPDKYQIT